MPLTVIDWQADRSFGHECARQALERDGAVLVRGLLSPDEIACARDQVRERLITGGEPIQLGRTQPNAAILAPEIGWLISHPQIVEVFRQLLAEQMLFTGHCDIHMNMLSGWHKDSGEHVGGYFNGNYFAAEECYVYKAAVYLQDATTSDGLTVALGSHRHPGHQGQIEWVPSKAGDVVFFDVRLSHTGQLPDKIETVIKAAAKLQQKKNRHDPVWATAAKSAYWKLIGRRDRLSVFFTYGVDNRFTEEFAAANMMRQNQQTGQLEALVIPDALDRSLRNQGIESAACCRLPTVLK